MDLNLENQKKKYFFKQSYAFLYFNQINCLKVILRMLKLDVYIA